MTARGSLTLNGSSRAAALLFPERLNLQLQLVHLQLPMPRFDFLVPHPAHEPKGREYGARGSGPEQPCFSTFQQTHRQFDIDLLFLKQAGAFFILRQETLGEATLRFPAVRLDVWNKVRPSWMLYPVVEIVDPGLQSCIRIAQDQTRLCVVELFVAPDKHVLDAGQGDDHDEYKSNAERHAEMTYA